MIRLPVGIVPQSVSEGPPDRVSYGDQRILPVGVELSQSNQPKNFESRKACRVLPSLIGFGCHRAILSFGQGCNRADGDLLAASAASYEKCSGAHPRANPLCGFDRLERKAQRPQPGPQRFQSGSLSAVLLAWKSRTSRIFSPQGASRTTDFERRAEEIAESETVEWMKVIDEIRVAKLSGSWYDYSNQMEVIHGRLLPLRDRRLAPLELSLPRTRKASAEKAKIPEMKFNDGAELARRASSPLLVDQAPTDKKTIPFGCSTQSGSSQLLLVVVDANFSQERWMSSPAIRKTTDKPIKYVLDTAPPRSITPTSLGLVEGKSPRIVASKPTERLPETNGPWPVGRGPAKDRKDIKESNSNSRTSPSRRVRSSTENPARRVHSTWPLSQRWAATWPLIFFPSTKLSAQRATPA